MVTQNRITTTRKAYPSGIACPERSSRGHMNRRGSRAHGYAQEPRAVGRGGRRAGRVWREGRVLLPSTGIRRSTLYWWKWKLASSPLRAGLERRRRMRRLACFPWK